MYRGQVTAIRRALARAGLGAVEVATVDGYQGREQEVRTLALALALALALTLT